VALYNCGFFVAAPGLGPGRCPGPGPGHWSVPAVGVLLVLRELGDLKQMLVGNWERGWRLVLWELGESHRRVAGVQVEDRGILRPWGGV
jgi:hypothetical protein